MNRLKNATILVALPLFALSCKNKMAENKAMAENYSRADSASYEPAMPQTAIGNMGLMDTARKFVVTSEIKFRVKDVVDATYTIEALLMKTGGFVTYSELRSTIDNTTTTRISPDSSVESIRYTMHNSMVLRVPKMQLDTFLRGIRQTADFFDYRIIKADDVELSLLENQLSQKRLQEYDKRQKKAIDKSYKSADETIITEESLLDKQQQADAAMLQNLRMQENIKYSTITLDIYQRQSIKQEMVANGENIRRYEPSFGNKLWQSLVNGWEIFENFIVFLARFWALILLITAGVIIYRKVWKKYGNK